MKAKRMKVYVLILCLLFLGLCRSETVSKDEFVFDYGISWSMSPDELIQVISNVSNEYRSVKNSEDGLELVQWGGCKKLGMDYDSVSFLYQQGTMTRIDCYYTKGNWLEILKQLRATYGEPDPIFSSTKPFESLITGSPDFIIEGWSCDSITTDVFWIYNEDASTHNEWVYRTSFHKQR